MSLSRSVARKLAQEIANLHQKDFDALIEKITTELRKTNGYIFGSDHAAPVKNEAEWTFSQSTLNDEPRINIPEIKETQTWFQSFISYIWTPAKQEEPKSISDFVQSMLGKDSKLSEASKLIVIRELIGLLSGMSKHAFEDSQLKKIGDLLLAELNPVLSIHAAKPVTSNVEIKKALAPTPKAKLHSYISDPAQVERERLAEAARKEARKNQTPYVVDQTAIETPNVLKPSVLKGLFNKDTTINDLNKYINQIPSAPKLSKR